MSVLVHNRCAALTIGNPTSGARVSEARDNRELTMKITYTAHATAANGGRGVGDAQTDDGRLAVKFSKPKAMGGDDGPGTNPEQLVALAYSACFLGAMGAAAKRNGKTLPAEATVTADVSFADREDKVGFTMVPKLTAQVPDGRRQTSRRP